MAAAAIDADAAAFVKSRREKDYCIVVTWEYQRALFRRSSPSGRASSQCRLRRGYQIDRRLAQRDAVRPCRDLPVSRLAVECGKQPRISSDRQRPRRARREIDTFKSEQP